MTKVVVIVVVVAVVIVVVGFDIKMYLLLSPIAYTH